MALDETVKRVEKRRPEIAAKYAAKAEAGDANTEKFRVLWTAACPEHPGAWGDRWDMKQAMERVEVFDATVEDIPDFFRWLVQEWFSLRRRTGTDWMAERGMLPRHPNMRFVLYHWSHFHAAYLDRDREKGLDYVDPNVDALLDDIGFLEMRLDEAAKFGHEAQLARLKTENEKLRTENAQLRAQLTPLVDVDLELPTWEERDV